MSIFQDVKAAGIQFSSHESDLYIPVTPETMELLKKHGLYAETFTNQVEGGRWYDVPFAYEPFWEARNK